MKRAIVLGPVVTALALGACTRAVQISSAPSASTADLTAAEDAGDGDAGRRRATFIGVWHGIGKQSDGVRWNAVVTIRAAEGERCATVRYPSLNCTTTWNCTANAGAALTARERRVSGRCDDNVNVRLTRDGEGLRMQMTATTGGATAEGILLPGDTVDTLDDEIEE